MNVVIYANCQGIGIKKFIHALTRFDENISVKNFENYRIINGEEPIEPLHSAARNADFFIYQPLGPSQGMYSTQEGMENVRSSVRPGCEFISFPYIYNNGLWPLFHEITAQNAAPVVSILQGGGSVQDVIAAYDAGEMFFNIRERIKLSLDILRVREAGLDIKVGDFFEANYNDNELLLVQSHPSSIMFLQATQDICKIMFGASFRAEDSSAIMRDNNYAGLPGRYPVDKYCIEEGNLNYLTGPDDGAQYYYHELIRQIANEWSAVNCTDQKAEQG